MTPEELLHAWVGEAESLRSECHMLRLENASLRDETKEARDGLWDSHPLLFNEDGTLDDNPPLLKTSLEVAARVEHLRKLHAEAVEGELEQYIRAETLAEWQKKVKETFKEFVEIKTTGFRAERYEMLKQLMAEGTVPNGEC